MTDSELKDLRNAIDAHLKGMAVQYKSPNSDGWLDATTPCWSEHNRYRPKPQLKTRYWNCGADVPSPCWLKFNNESWGDSLVIAVLPTGVVIANLNGSTCLISWMDLACITTSHSTTRKPDSWHPCKVTDGEG